MSAFLLRQNPSPPQAFPLAQHSSGRYFVDAQGRPRPILGRTSWLICSLSETAYQSYIDNTLTYGFNTIEMMAAYKWQVTQVTGAPTAPQAGNGELPFLKRLDGSAWNGSFSYSNVNTDAPDFTTPNELYWRHIDQLLRYLQFKGIFVLFFPAYVGYDGQNQGFQDELVANGQTRMQTYGAWIQNRYKDMPNLMWMLGGDKGTPHLTFTTAEANAQRGLVDGLKSVAAALSKQYGAEWHGSDVDEYSFGPEATTNALGAELTVHGLYSWVGQQGKGGRDAYAATPTLPAYYMEGPYDEEGPDSLNFNPNAVQPIRRYNHNGIINTIGGYVNGNGFVWPFGSTYAAHLNVPGVQQCGHLNRLWLSLPWWRLVPSGLNGMGTLITAGGGTLDATTYVASACTPEGDCMIVYSGPGHTGTLTVDMTKMRGTITATWHDPTSGARSSAGSFPNTGTQAFTPPTNSLGEADMNLILAA